jgi:Fic-DOC domain mobile mystery protein B
MEQLVSSWPTVPGETSIDVSHLKVEGVGTRAELNNLEAENIRKVVVRYLGRRPTRRMAPFDLAWLKRLHQQMFGDVWKWAGHPRPEDLNIGIRWHLIDERLQAFVGDLAFWDETDMDVLESAIRLHHRAVHIHPFPKGNGRWARMLANIWLRAHDGSVTEWPESEIGTASPIRNDYLAALKAADEGDYEPLQVVHRRHTPMPTRSAGCLPNQAEQADTSDP